MNHIKKKWTEIDKHFLSINSNNMKDEEMAALLRRSLKSVREMRRRLGLVKESGRGKVQLKGRS